MHIASGNTTHSTHARACGILFCYNEAHILRECLLHYLSLGFDLVLIDNMSTDGSMHIAKEIRCQPTLYSGSILDIVQIPTDGYEWEKILAFACDYMHKSLSHYEWILLIDADAFYYSPVKGMSLWKFMEATKESGFNVIDGALCEFYPTEKDDLSIISPVERLQYCRVYNPSPQHKIFLYHPTIQFLSGGHILKRENPRVSIIKFLYLHYQWVSFEHGVQKIFKERKPRYVELRSVPTIHPQYRGLLPIKEDLIKNSYTLCHYNKEMLLMSKLIFFTAMRFSTPIKVFLSLQKILSRGWIRRVKFFVEDFFVVFRYDKTFFLKDLKRRVKELVKHLVASLYKPTTSDDSSRYNPSVVLSSAFQKASLAEMIRQKPFCVGLPESYHFLMTDFCNAACIFCNQDFDPRARNQITLDRFKVMLSHIPVTKGNTFVFSGGGDPLICKDLFEIIELVHKTFPKVKSVVRTNGLLIGKLADRLARSPLNRLEISVHGATSEENHELLRGIGKQDVFYGISLLNEELKRHCSAMRKIFCPVVSRVNIDQIPSLLERAAELNIQEVTVVFSRYYPWQKYQIKDEDRARPEDSLFYDKERYNEVIIRSKKIAKSLGIDFRHEPLFFNQFKKRRCFQPWCTMLVDWDGEVFPCTGGEVWFNQKVRQEGSYQFGNLLKEHLADFWNNETYTYIRRTLGSQYKEAFIPECTNCHNIACFEGPDIKCGHILEPLISNPKVGIKDSTIAKVL